MLGEFLRTAAVAVSRDGTACHAVGNPQNPNRRFTSSSHICRYARGGDSGLS
jgi:hypothetical protein